MKNIKFLLSLMLVMAVGLVSCDNDYAEPPVTIPEGGIGTGAWDNPMTAYQVLIGSENENYSTPWVRGYIVGWVNTDVSTSLSERSAEFNATNAVTTNLLMAMDPNETNWENCCTVQLPSGDVRTALNLSANPGNLGKLVCVRGTTGSKYCSVYGVKSVSEYNWGEVGLEPDPAFELPNGSKQVVALSFTAGMQDFTFDQGDSGVETWKQSSSYGLVATGGVSNSTAKATDARAISPEFDLTAYGEIRLAVRSAANYFGSQDGFLEMCQVLVCEAGTENWEAVTLPVPPSGTSWSYSDSGYVNLDSYAGKKIQVAFRYTSTTSLSGTWEIDSMEIQAVPAN